MSRTGRSRVSRRDMLVSPLAIPLIGTASAQAGSVRAPQSGEPPDPVVAVAAAWIAKRQSLEAMIFEWQRLEKQLIKRVKTFDSAIDEGRFRKFPEALAMKALDRRMDRAYGVLENLASDASRLPAVGSEAALAKVDLGLRVQGQYSWQPYALKLLESGAKELDTFLAR